MLGRSRQAYYKQIRSQSEKQFQEMVVLEAVREIRRELPQTGTVKLIRECRETWESKGIRMGRDRTYSLLRDHHMLLRKTKKTRPKTTWSKHWLNKYSNLIQEVSFTHPNQLWVADITYLPIESPGRWCYLFLITDAVSRKIVGYHVSKGLDARSAEKALSMALKQNADTKGLIHHSDRGIQYCSNSYVKKLKMNGMRISMTQTGSPYENALAERINGIIKHELIYPFGAIATIQEASNRVEKAVQLYNRKRLHSSIGYRTPELTHQTSQPIPGL